MISSPLGRDDIFYDKFRSGFSNPDLILSVQAPTWEVNPSIPASEFEKRYILDTRKFFVEFGAEFSDRSSGWIEERKDLVACIDPKLVIRTKAVKSAPHYMGIDIGVTKNGDGSAIAVGHIDNGVIVLDVLDTMIAGIGKYANYDRLDFGELAKWIHDYTKKFRVTEGVMDQWSGIALEQHLNKLGLTQIKFKQFTQSDTTMIFKIMKDMMWDGKVKLYNYDLDHGFLGNEEDCQLCGYLEELMSLQEERVSRTISEIEAPRGEHDDRSYALSRMIWLASKDLGKKRITFGNDIKKSGGKSVINNSFVSREEYVRRILKRRGKF
jgi:hypothetical protein